MAQEHMAAALTYFKYVRLEFRMTVYKEGAMGDEDLDIWFAATTEMADKVARAVSLMARDTLVSTDPVPAVRAVTVGPEYSDEQPDYKFELIGEGEFRGWTVEEIAESFARQARWLEIAGKEKE